MIGVNGIPWEGIREGVDGRRRYVT